MRDIANPVWCEDAGRPEETPDETQKAIAQNKENPKKRLLLGVSGELKLRGGYPTVVEVSERLRDILTEWKELYHITLLCPFQGEGDLLTAESAIELKIPVIAILKAPLRTVLRRIHENSVGRESTELRYRQAFANCDSVRVVDEYALDETETEPGAYIASRCDALLAIWNGKTLPLSDGNGSPCNRASTFAIIRKAQERGVWVHVIPCPR